MRRFRRAHSRTRARGILLLGVDERKGFAPAEPFNLDRVRDQFVSDIGDGGATNTKLTNPPHNQMERVDVDGAQVLAVSILELHQRLKPCYITARGIQAGSYKRVDNKNERLSPTKIYKLASILVPSSTFLKSSCRGRLRRLLAVGKVVATAPATSKKRRYLLAR